MRGWMEIDGLDILHEFFIGNIAAIEVLVDLIPLIELWIASLHSWQKDLLDESAKGRNHLLLIVHLNQVTGNYV